MNKIKVFHTFEFFKTATDSEIVNVTFTIVEAERQL